MIKKFTIFIYIIFSLTSCGYSPIYSTKDTNFEILNFDLEGDSKVNYFIENGFKKYFNNDGEKKYNIKIKTNYEKASASKDKTGNTTHYRLIVNLIMNYERVNLNQDKKTKEVSFSENLIIKRDENNFEQDKYEKVIINNMSELLVNKVILYLSNN